MPIGVPWLFKSPPYSLRQRQSQSPLHPNGSYGTAIPRPPPRLPVRAKTLHLLIDLFCSPSRPLALRHGLGPPWTCRYSRRTKVSPSRHPAISSRLLPTSHSLFCPRHPIAYPPHLSARLASLFRIPLSIQRASCAPLTYLVFINQSYDQGTFKSPADNSPLPVCSLSCPHAIKPV